MAKRSRGAGRNTGGSTPGVVELPRGARPDGPVAGVYYIDTGDCELIPDQDNSTGWLLRINGVMSSHIDLADPLFLDFEYMRWIAALVESRWPPAGRPKLRALHLGGGACSLARYFHAAYPDARQVVVELDGKLAEYVRRWFDLPKAPLLRLRVGEARAVTETLTPGHPRLHHPGRLRRRGDPVSADHGRVQRARPPGARPRRHLRGQFGRRP
jgi:hypothetical protein